MSISRSRRTSPSTVATSSAASRVAGKRNHLVEGALRVAHAAVAGARDQHQRGVVHLDLLGVGNPAELVGDWLEPDRLQLEDLRARLDGRGHLLDLGRRHHEHDVRRGLLDRLEERVEGRVRQAMDFVDDEDLVAVAGGRDAEAGDDNLADLVDLGVGRGVDLEHVHVAPLGDFDAGVADAAGVRGRPLVAVQSACEDAGGRRLADAARAGKHERLGDAPGGDGVAQRLRDAALADHVLEPLRTPFARQDLVCGHVSVSKVERLRSGPYRDPGGLRHMRGSA